MNGPAIYRIIVRGTLDPSWASRLGGMSITERHLDEGGVDMILVGRLQDQAALSGVLNALYELHLPVVSVDCMEAG
jgi:hypothetical protein